MSEQLLKKEESASQAERVKKTVQLGIFCAIAYLLMVVGRVPVVLFLKYDPKDVIITIGGFIYGPLSAVMISAVVSLVEMFTVSETGIIGLIMNMLSTCAFVCTAAVYYKKVHTVKGAVTGLVAGGIFMTVVMLLWNYLMTPIYMGYPREAVAELLLPVFLPFNLLKACLNGAITMLVYKPVVTALRKAGLVAPSVSGSGGERSRGNIRWGVFLTSAVVLITCILLVLVMQGKM